MENEIIAYNGMKFSEIYQKLCLGVCPIIFTKANGEMRIMLATKNEGIPMIATGKPVPSRYIKESRETGTIAVIDLEKMERRSFCVERLMCIEDYGQINTSIAYNKVLNDFIKFKKKYLANLGVEEE